MAISLMSLFSLSLFSALFIWTMFVVRRGRDDIGSAPPVLPKKSTDTVGRQVLDATLSLTGRLLAVLDKDYTIVTLSPMLSERINAPSNALIGAHLSTLVEAAILPSGNAPAVVETQNARLLMQNQEETTVALKMTRIDRDDGKTVGYLLDVLREDGNIRNTWNPTDAMRQRWETLLANQTQDLEAKNRELEASGRRLQELVDRIGHIKDKEGMRISQVLRDELNSILFVIRNNVVSLKTGLDTSFEKRVSAALTAVDSALEHVDRIIDGIRPPMLDRVGLGAALETMTSNFEKNYRIACRTRLIVAEERIGVDLATAICKIVQESLTNIARHSGATEARVSLNDGPEGIRLIVEDNGRGIDAKALNDDSALGIMGMRERAKAFGGHLDVAPSRDGGTIVRLFVPAQR